MKPKRPEKMHKICRDCYHYLACQMWNIGGLANTDSENCINFEPVVKLIWFFVGTKPKTEGSGVTWWNVCGRCSTGINPNDKYCHECGAKIKWPEVEE